MKIEFRKITNRPKPIHIAFDGKHDMLDEGECVELDGDIMRENTNIVSFKGRMSGRLNLICAKSGEDFVKALNEELVLYFSDGIWEAQSQSKNIDSLDVIEFFDGFIDFDFILESEIESIRLDYNIKE